MNLETMETALRRFGFDKQDPLATWINAAMHDLEDCFDWPWLESKATLEAMPSGSSTITLPANALKVITIKDMTNFIKLEYYDRHKFVREIKEPEEVGQPTVYTLVNTTEIQVWRILQEAITFEVQYQATTPDLVLAASEPTTGTSVWPPNTHYIIVQKAAAIALQAENEEERAKNALEQYTKAVENLMRKFGERELDEPSTVQDVMGYGHGTMRRWG